MSKRINFRCAIVLSALGLFISRGIAAPEGWVIQQISSGGMISPWELVVDGNEVAYIDGGQVMLWSGGNQSRRISSGQQECSNVRLCGEKMAWLEWVDVNWQVMYWDGQIIRQISSGLNGCQDIQLSNSCVIWLESIANKNQVLFWDGQQTRQISEGLNNCTSSVLSSGKVAWIESIQDKGRVIFWNGITRFQLSSGQNYCDQLQISNGNVVWREHLGSNKYSVILWDGQVNRQISSGQTEIRDVQFSEGIIVWIESNRQVMLWDGQMTRQLSSGQNYCLEIRLSGGKAIWLEQIGGSQQMMFWDGKERIHISQNLKQKSQLHVWDSELIWSEYQMAAFQFTPRSRLMYWKDGRMDLLAVVDVSMLPCAVLSSSIVTWVGLDSMDDWQIYVAMKGENAAVIKGPEGDINRDLKVDLSDLAIMSSNWLGKAKERIAGKTLDRNPGWICQGPWEFGRPMGMGGTEKGYADPQVGATGQNVYGVNLFGDYSTKDGEPYSLTAGPFDCSRYEKVELAFARWLNTDSADYVRCSVEVSNDGSNWQTVWTNPAEEGVFDSAWKPVNYDIGAFADGHAQVLLRWTHRILSDRAFACSGWNIDDVELWGEE